MTRFFAMIALAVMLTGCTDLGGVMGRTDGTPTVEPAPKLDCDLIFPPASVMP